MNNKPLTGLAGAGRASSSCGAEKSISSEPASVTAMLGAVDIMLKTLKRYNANDRRSLLIALQAINETELD